MVLIFNLAGIAVSFCLTQSSKHGGQQFRGCLVTGTVETPYALIRGGDLHYIA
jgi:hypothetical protein